MSVRVCNSEDLEPGHALRAVINDVPVAVARDDDGEFHAIGDTCSHEEISLSEGFVEGHTIECWAHGATFDLLTGKALTLPATEPVPVYPVSVVDGGVYVEIGEGTSGGCCSGCSCHAEAAS